MRLLRTIRGIAAAALLLAVMPPAITPALAGDGPMPGPGVKSVAGQRPIAGDVPLTADKLGAVSRRATLNDMLLAPVSAAARLHRDGYYASGDGGAADYNPSTSPCTQNGGAGDGGSEIPSPDGGCWLIDKVTSEFNLFVFGGKGTSAEGTQAADVAAVNNLWAAAKRLNVNPHFGKAPSHWKLDQQIVLDYRGWPSPMVELFLDGADFDSQNVVDTFGVTLVHGITSGPTISIQCGVSRGTDTSACQGIALHNKGYIRCKTPDDVCFKLGKSDLSDTNQAVSIDNLQVSNSSTAPGAGACQFNLPTTDESREICNTLGGGWFNRSGIAAGAQIVSSSMTSWKHLSAGAGLCTLNVRFPCDDFSKSSLAHAVLFADAIPPGTVRPQESNVLGETQDLEVSPGCLGITSSLFFANRVAGLFTACFNGINVSLASVLNIQGTPAPGEQFAVRPSSVTGAPAVTYTAVTGDTPATAAQNFIAAFNTSTLKNNYGFFANTAVRPEGIFSLTASGTTVTAVVSVSRVTLVPNVGDYVAVQGADQAEFNGTVRINTVTPTYDAVITTKLTGLSFTYTVGAPSVANATGNFTYMPGGSSATVYLMAVSGLMPTATWAVTQSSGAALTTNAVGSIIPLVQTVGGNTIDTLTTAGYPSWDPGQVTGFSVISQGTQGFYFAPLCATYVVTGLDSNRTISSANADSSVGSTPACQVRHLLAATANVGDTALTLDSVTGVVPGMNVISYGILGGGTTGTPSGNSVPLVGVVVGGVASVSTGTGTTATGSDAGSGDMSAPATPRMNISAPVAFTPTGHLGVATTFRPTLPSCVTINGVKEWAVSFLAEGGNPIVVGLTGADFISYSGSTVTSLAINALRDRATLRCNGRFWMLENASAQVLADNGLGGASSALWTPTVTIGGSTTATLATSPAPFGSCSIGTNKTATCTFSLVVTSLNGGSTGGNIVIGGLPTGIIGNSYALFPLHIPTGSLQSGTAQVLGYSGPSQTTITLKTQGSTGDANMTASALALPATLQGTVTMRVQ